MKPTVRQISIPKSLLQQHRLGQHRFELRSDGRGWKCTKWSNQHRLGFFRGVTRSGHFIERVWGLGLCRLCQVTRRETLSGALGARRFQFPCDLWRFPGYFATTSFRSGFGFTLFDGYINPQTRVVRPSCLIATAGQTMLTHRIGTCLVDI